MTPRTLRSTRTRARTMATGLAAVLALVGAGSPRTARAGDGPGPTVLDAPPTVEGLRLADVDGDGILDVLTVGGREIRAFPGRKDGRVAAAPAYAFTLPPDATFAWPAPRRAGSDEPPALLALGAKQILRLRAGFPPVVEEGVTSAVPWADPAHAVLTEFVRGKALVLPTAAGFRWIPDLVAARRTVFDLDLPPVRKVTPPGPFLEDVALLSSSWPSPTLVGAGPLGGPAVFAVGAQAIHAFTRLGERIDHVAWPTAFLPRRGEHRDMLVDLDADGIPDLCHEATTNDSGTYAFFRVPTPAALPPGATPAGARSGGDLRPVRGTIRLKGFQFPPDYVDLDADGLQDFVVTTIDIDGGNVMRAVMKGRVVAKTRAWRNRGGTGDFFLPSPDAEVDSEIGVRILFTFSGSIEVKRSFTILATADVDGDRRKDLVIRSGPETLSVYAGVTDGVWAKEPRTVRIPAVGSSPDVEGYVGDLTGDGKDDLVLLYRAPPGGADRTVVLPMR